MSYFPDEMSALRALVRYDKADGKFYYKDRPLAMFEGRVRSAEHEHARQNAMLSGKEALCSDNGNGYLRGRVDGFRVYAHRAVWAFETGAWPDGDIDHINGNTTDNRIENLRCVPHKINQRNSKRSLRNKSGITGVIWHKGASKWAASIVVDGVSTHLGLFDDKEDARKARLEAEKENGFHENHGRHHAC